MKYHLSFSRISMVRHLHDRRTTVVRHSCDGRENVQNRLKMTNYRNFFVRVSHECLANIARLSRDMFAKCMRTPRERGPKFANGSCKCRESVVRYSCDCHIFVVNTSISETSTENCRNIAFASQAFVSN